ncbi:fumarylacetoacetate hydrolase family protein [Arthrobacter sp. V1I7]|uniref:fumarylacetoacetate hydrolase family protein n=1 Tax=Arthrobacter sp. V1I7 TaxID=3042274 RepID=UPI0027D8A0D2|nr:fumarylacetoacetate hydrolase family protein [Arthrobacter sp. V1I7]
MGAHGEQNTPFARPRTAVNSNQDQEEKTNGLRKLPIQGSQLHRRSSRRTPHPAGRAHRRRTGNIRRSPCQCCPSDGITGCPIRSHPPSGVTKGREDPLRGPELQRPCRRRQHGRFPVLFPKYTSTLIGPADDIILPPESTQVDFEGELAVIIGRTGRRIAEQDAMDHVLGYCVSNDVTMRDYQNRSHQWLQGKVWDNTTPVGPYIVTRTEADISKAGISTTLNGEVVQKSDLSHLIFSIPTLIATITEFTTLEPGDVILTGTPSGVGYRRDPQLFLKDSDTITVTVEGVGSITNTVRAETA